MLIKNAQYVGSFIKESDAPVPETPEYAFIGRSNVGKSSLINMLCDRKNLAYVSKSPGKTQTLNFFLINNSWNLVDLPGYGFARSARQQRDAWEKMIDEYIKNRKNLVCLFLLIDSRRQPQKADFRFLEKLGSWQIPFSVIFTKTDKPKPGERQQNIYSFFEEMKKNWEFLPNYFLSSAVKNTGREEILDFIEEYNIRFGAIA